MSKFPKSPTEETSGMAYFPRMIDKIRLHAAGELSPEYHKNLGARRSADGLCLNFLRIKYDDLCARVHAGGTDEEILEWCYENGRRLNRGDLLVWNSFITKFGWNDFQTPTLEQLKKEASSSYRDDIRTISELIDFDEGRKK